MSSRRFTGSAKKKTSTPSNSVEFYRIRIIFLYFTKLGPRPLPGLFCCHTKAPGRPRIIIKLKQLGRFRVAAKPEATPARASNTRISKEARESANGARCATSSAATFFLGLPRKGVCAGAFRSGARSGSGLRPRAFFSGIRI